jgi:hypothetical protein
MTPEERAEYNRAYRVLHKENISASAKSYRLRHDPKLWSEKNRASHIKVKYGLTIDEYNAILSAQGNVCAICKRADWNGKGPHIDHDHETKRVRGILCASCNTAIGFIKENPIIAWAMAEYLKRKCNRRPEYFVDFGSKVLYKKELAEILQISMKTVDRWCSKRNLPFHYAGRRKTFIPADLKAWAIVASRSFGPSHPSDPSSSASA